MALLQLADIGYPKAHLRDALLATYSFNRVFDVNGNCLFSPKSVKENEHVQWMVKDYQENVQKPFFAKEDGIAVIAEGVSIREDRVVGLSDDHKIIFKCNYTGVSCTVTLEGRDIKLMTLPVFYGLIHWELGWHAKAIFQQMMADQDRISAEGWKLYAKARGDYKDFISLETTDVAVNLT